MTVKDFSGGLRLRPYEADISLLYGRKYYDIDHQRGSLIPLKKPLKLSSLTAECLYNDDNNGIAITSNRPITFTEHSSDTIHYTLSWTTLTDIDNFYQVDNTLIRGGRNGYFVSFIYRFTDGKGNYTEWSDEVTICLPENGNSTARIGRPYVEEELVNSGLNICEVWVARKKMLDFIQDWTHFDYVKLVDKTNFITKNGYKVVADNINFNSANVNWDAPKEKVNRADLKPDKDIFSRRAFDTYVLDDSSGHHPLYRDSFEVLTPVWQTQVNGELAHAQSTFLVGDRVCTSCGNNDWHITYTFDNVLHYNGAYTQILCWRDKGWMDICDVAHSHCVTHSPPSDQSPMKVYPTVRKGAITYEHNETTTHDNPNNIAGKYAPLGCKYPLTWEDRYDNKGHLLYSRPDEVTDILSLDGAFTYSHILNKFIPHSKDGSVIDFKGRVYLIDRDKAFVIDPNKGNWANMHLPTPNMQMPHTINNIGDTTEPYKVKYRLTYYNSQYEIESMPTDPIEFELTSDKVEISFLDPTQGVNADRLRVYRLSKGLIDYTLTLELPLNVDADLSIYKDLVNKDDLDDIAGKLQLMSVTDSSVPKGLKYVTATNSIMVGALEDKLYFSTAGKPSVWKRTDYIDFDTDITGIGAINNGIVVFTLNETYLIVGNSVNTFAKYLVSKEVGCIEHKTIQPFNNGLLFISYDGIYYTQGSTIKNVSDNLLGNLKLDNNKIINAIVVNNQYHLALTTDDIFKSDYFEPLNTPIILVLDARFNTMFRMIRENTKWLGEKHRDVISLGQDNNLYDVYPDSTPYKEMLFESGHITLGRFTEIKMFNDVYIAYEDNIHLNIELLTKQRDKQHIIHNKSLPIGKRVENINTKGFIEGYAIIITVNGNGKVHEIDFTAKGHMNGK